MGRERACVARIDGRTTKGKVLLETDEVLFRGEPRVRVKLKDLTRVAAEEGELHLAWKGGEAAFELGAEETARWVEAILHPRTRAQKLGVKPGARVSLVGVRDASLSGELEAVGADVSRRARKESDAVFLQVDDAAGLAGIAKARESLADAGALWIVSPRGALGLKDTDVMRVAKAAGLVDVKVVRFSETHTANKFVVPKAKRRAS